LKDKLVGFEDLVIQDSTIIRLHEKLADKWPAARTKKVAAGLMELFQVYQSQAFDPNVDRKRLMDQWRA
jgi:hypothetical protein